MEGVGDEGVVRRLVVKDGGLLMDSWLGKEGRGEEVRRGPIWVAKC